MKPSTLIREWRRRQQRVPELGDRHVIADWNLDNGAMIDMHRYGQLLAMLPDKITDSLERARLERAGVGPMLKMGLGYEELLTSVIVDGTAIASSSTEAFLVPAVLLPANYLQPGGIPGRTLRVQARGRHTTLTTAATLTYKIGAATTNAIPTTTWAVSGAITMDTTAQTDTMWALEAQTVVRSVGSSGTVFAMGRANTSGQAVTIANQTAGFMGSAGSATPSSATVDMTVPQYFSLTGKWSLTTAYSVQAHQFLLEALN